MIWERIWDKIALAWFLRRKKLSLQVLGWRSFLGIKTIHGLKCEVIHSFKNQFVLQLCVLGIKNQFVLQLCVDIWQAKMKDLTFCCPVCSKDFSTKRKLKNHSYIHEESQETCDQCGELFSNKVKLRNHSRSHQVFLTNHASPPDFFCCAPNPSLIWKSPPDKNKAMKSAPLNL